MPYGPMMLVTFENSCIPWKTFLILPNVLFLKSAQLIPPHRPTPFQKSVSYLPRQGSPQVMADILVERPMACDN